MKKTLILLLLLIVAGGSAWYFTKSKEAAKMHAMGWDRDFAVKNTEDIYKIFIAKRTGKTTTLERKGNQWLIDGKYPARMTAIKSLMDVFRGVRMQSVPPKAAVKGIVDNLATQGIKVELYDKSNDIIKAFYVGGSTNDERGTYMILEGAERPFITELSMMEGAFRVRFDMEGDAWRDKTVFDEEVEDIDFVSIEYPKQKSKSFIMERKSNGFEVKPFYEITQPINKPVQQGNVEAFLLGFRKQIAESYDNQNPKKAAYLTTIPFAIITMRNRSGNEKSATLYSKGSLSAQGNVKTNMVERYLANVKRGEFEDFLMVQHRNYKRILWGYDGFF
ncbi:MAG: hypothetical protein ACI9XO_000916 [Paraglaciecola sp.]|jgi:hypothetical protein